MPKRWRRSARCQPSTAPLLLSAVYDIGDLTLKLTYDRPITLTGDIDGTEFTMYTGSRIKQGNTLDDSDVDNFTLLLVDVGASVEPEGLVYEHITSSVTDTAGGVWPAGNYPITQIP